MTAPDHSGNLNWNVDAAIESVARRVEQIANRMEDVILGESRPDSNELRQIAPQTGEMENDAPSNPIRHWRWE
jgi:hypothetical protein